MLDKATEDKIALLARDGDPEAFQALWEGTHVALRSLIIQILGSGNSEGGIEDIHGKAEEILQDIYLKVFLNFNKTFDPTKRFMPWVVQITRNYCYTYKRDLAIHKRLYRDKVIPRELAVPAPDATKIVEDLAISEVLWRNIEKAADEMNEDPHSHADNVGPILKEAMKLRFINGLSWPELGERFNMKPEAIRARVRQLQQRLAKSEEIKAHYVSV